MKKQNDENNKSLKGEVVINLDDFKKRGDAIRLLSLSKEKYTLFKIGQAYAALDSMKTIPTLDYPIYSKILHPQTPTDVYESIGFLKSSDFLIGSVMKKMASIFGNYPFSNFSTSMNPIGRVIKEIEAISKSYRNFLDSHFTHLKIETDEKLSLQEKIKAFELTIKKLITYVEKHYKNSAFFDKYFDMILNLENVIYTNSDRYVNGRFTKFTTFLTKLKNARMNWIAEDGEGVFYDDLFDITIEFIEGLEAFSKAYMKFIELSSLNALQLAVNENAFEEVNFIRCMVNFVSKKSNYNQTFLCCLIATIAEANTIEERGLTEVIGYLLYTNRQNRDRLCNEQPQKQLIANAQNLIARQNLFR